MSEQLTNALLAIVLGTVVAVLLLIPVAAVQYRRVGRLSPGDLAVLLTGAVYGLALWTYTLLPMPADDDFACAGRQTVPFDTIRTIDWSHVGSRHGVSHLVHDPAFLQVVLNVLLFVPLGYYVRRVIGRGPVASTVLGFGISLLIETTQATGVWRLYGCAYRVFDVDDLMVNTMGATAGSLLAALLVRRSRGEVVVRSSITLGRRLTGMACDALFVVLLGASVAIGYRAVQIYALDVPYDAVPATTQRLLQWGVPAAVQLALVLLAGRTVGEWVVSVRAVTRRRRALLARPVKFMVGVGPLVLLLALPAGWTGPVLLGFVVATVVAALPTREHRGLAHLASGMDLEVVSPARQPGRDDVLLRRGP